MKASPAESAERISPRMKLVFWTGSISTINGWFTSKVSSVAIGSAVYQLLKKALMTRLSVSLLGRVQDKVKHTIDVVYDVPCFWVNARIDRQVLGLGCTLIVRDLRAVILISPVGSQTNKAAGPQFVGLAAGRIIVTHWDCYVPVGDIGVQIENGPAG